jgi:hypothetical protein
MVAYVDELLNDGKPTEAEPFIARLREAVNDPRAAATAAKFYCLANSSERVLEVVDKYEHGADPGTPEGLSRLRQTAEILDQSGRLAVAKGLTRQPISTRHSRNIASPGRAFPNRPDRWRPFSRSPVSASRVRFGRNRNRTCRCRRDNRRDECRPRRQLSAEAL